MVIEMPTFSMKCFTQDVFNTHKKAKPRPGKEGGTGREVWPQRAPRPELRGQSIPAHAAPAPSLPTCCHSALARSHGSVVGNWCVCERPTPATPRKEFIVTVYMEICDKEHLFYKRQMGEIFTFKELT